MPTPRRTDTVYICAMSPGDARHHQQTLQLASGMPVIHFTDEYALHVLEMPFVGRLLFTRRVMREMNSEWRGRITDIFDAGRRREEGTVYPFTHAVLTSSRLQFKRWCLEFEEENNDEEYMPLWVRNGQRVANLTLPHNIEIVNLFSRQGELYRSVQQVVEAHRQHNPAEVTVNVGPSGNITVGRGNTLMQEGTPIRLNERGQATPVLSRELVIDIVISGTHGEYRQWGQDRLAYWEAEDTPLDQRFAAVRADRPGALEGVALHPHVRVHRIGSYIGMSATRLAELNREVERALQRNQYRWQGTPWDVSSVRADIIAPGTISTSQIAAGYITSSRISESNVEPSNPTLTNALQQRVRELEQELSALRGIHNGLQRAVDNIITQSDVYTLQERQAAMHARSISLGDTVIWRAVNDPEDWRLVRVSNRDHASNRYVGFSYRFDPGSQQWISSAIPEITLGHPDTERDINYEDDEPVQPVPAPVILSDDEDDEEDEDDDTEVASSNGGITFRTVPTRRPRINLSAARRR